MIAGTFTTARLPIHAGFTNAVEEMAPPIALHGIASALDIIDLRAAPRSHADQRARFYCGTAL